MSETLRCRRKRACAVFLVLVTCATLSPFAAGGKTEIPLSAKRVLFVGDSITHSGGFVAWIETQYRLQGVSPLPEFINIGLSSETCTGLTEPDHPFPRPDVHERLKRALKRLRPDVVVACYGMNDGIYYPFSESRFVAYQEGINRLIDEVHATGAQLVLMTPPPFDAVPLMGREGKLKPAGEKKYAYFAIYEHYDRDVIARYAAWIRQQSERVAMVVDLYTPLTDHLAEQRRRDPKYTLSPDGVHPNPLGQRIIGETILQAWGVPSVTEPGDTLRELMERRMTVVRDAWLSAIGHKRPGVKQGLPVAEASRQSERLLDQAQPLIGQLREATVSRRASTGGEVHQVHYPAQLGGGRLRIAVDYYLWIPAGAKPLRGIIVHQHGCGVGASIGGRTAADDLHWQALARKWNCALLGSMYEPRKSINCRLWCDARNGSDARFLDALDRLAKSSERPEVTRVPWCLWGHSGGGFWASLMQAQHPDRIVAIWFRSGTAFGYWDRGEIEPPRLTDAVYAVPMVGNPGVQEKGDTRFRGAWDGLQAMRAAYLSRGATFFAFAPDPRTRHQCGDSRYMAIPYFDFWLEHRLPPSGAAEGKLRPAAPALAAWEKRLAPKLAEYIQTGSVSDTTPPPAPRRVVARRTAEGHVMIRWEADADLESGIRAFVLTRAGERLAQVPEQPTNPFGRPLFQGMTYHDTPQAPLAAMGYLDRDVAAGETPLYTVRSINSVGLESVATASR